MRTLLPLPLLLLLLSLATLSLATIESLSEDIKGTSNDGQCTYTLFVQTANLDNAGTSSVISLDLYGPDKGKDLVHINNLAKWGQGICPDGSFFQAGNLDVFRGTGPCRRRPPCFMILSTAGTGDSPNWKVDYVEVIIVGPIFATAAFQRFDVNEWLSPEQPHVIVDNCPCRCGRSISIYKANKLISVARNSTNKC